ncbi:MBL fold metallo-hydrolase [Nonomuraea indica]|uniref:MBL fold metallo-hydrolase n=1 Tax=Nonomuraea indica TaxID=1581193 RepID=A0ABW8ACP2_9ACTN
MRLTVLGGCGAWPGAGQACSGYLVERDGFTVLIDPGYATLPRLLQLTPAEKIDAVLVTHGHPDHCADLNPLLRARSLGHARPPALPVYAPDGALDAVLRLDERMSARAVVLHDLVPSRVVEVGPFRLETWALPHHVPNAGLRLSGGGKVIAYTGDSGPADTLVDLARDADLLLAEATHPEQIPGEDAPYLSTALQAGRTAATAGAARLLLTHLWPGTPPERALTAAARSYSGDLAVASGGVTVCL